MRPKVFASNTSFDCDFVLYRLGVYGESLRALMVFDCSGCNGWDGRASEVLSGSHYGTRISLWEGVCCHVGRHGMVL